MRKLLVPAACLLTAFAVACSGDSESASSASSTPRSESTATPVATATLAPTATPEPPTATPEPPTPEPTPEPPTPVPPPPAPSGPPVGQPGPGNPGPRPSGPPPGPSGPVSATITASGLAFTTRQINARAGASVTVTLSNQDAFVPHDVSISGVASIPSCVGPCTSGPISFTAPGPGSYNFFCTIHPDMTGRLVVSP